MSSADTPSRARGASPGPQGARPPAARMRGSGLNRGDQLLFLTDAQLRQGVELMFFAYRDMIADADRVLETRGYGRAHHRCLHFVWRRPGMSVSELLDTLKVTKQSLNRVLRQLVEDGMIASKVGPSDRRQRLLTVMNARSDEIDVFGCAECADAARVHGGGRRGGAGIQDGARGHDRRGQPRIGAGAGQRPARRLSGGP